MSYMSYKTEYKKGDIVVWSGHSPAILRIKEDFKADFKQPGHWMQCAKATYVPYASMHYSNLRPATKDEIERLGDLEVFFLDDNPETI